MGKAVIYFFALFPFRFAFFARLLSPFRDIPWCFAIISSSFKGGTLAFNHLRINARAYTILLFCLPILVPDSRSGAILNLIISS
jgi:hypothetical protein